MALPLRFPANPAYGTGVFHRRICVAKCGANVAIELLDDYHDMCCTLSVMGGMVTAVDGMISRAPFSTCPAAPSRLRELIGLPITATRRDLFAGGLAKRNCTHLFDMAALGFALSVSGDNVWRIGLVVPDLSPDGAQVTVSLNSCEVHRWTIDLDEIAQTPAWLADRTLFGGFSQWAAEHFAGVELELALHLQKAVFVARGRRYLMEPDSSNSLRDEPERIGACFTFSEPQFSVAETVPDYVRDFPDGLPERLETMT